MGNNGREGAKQPHANSSYVQEKLGAQRSRKQTNLISSCLSPGEDDGGLGQGSGMRLERSEWM